MKEGRVAGAESPRRLLRVLLSFTEQKPLWTVPDLASKLELSHSMVYRYIGLLREVGLVDVAGDSRYRLTDRTTALSDAANAARTPIGEVALPVLMRLRDAIDETVLVSRRDGWSVYAVQRVESRQPVRLQFDRGQAMALHRGSMSRILLAGLSTQAREQYRSTLDDETRTSDLLSDEALDRVAAEGVTESFEEIDEGIWGVAASVTLAGEIVGSLGCAAPIYRSDAQRRQRIHDGVVAAAAELSALLDDRTV